MRWRDLRKVTRNSEMNYFLTPDVVAFAKKRWARRFAP